MSYISIADYVANNIKKPAFETYTSNPDEKREDMRRVDERLTKTRKVVTRIDKIDDDYYILTTTPEIMSFFGRIESKSFVNADFQLWLDD